MRSRSEKIGLVLSLFGIINIGIAIAIHSVRDDKPKEKAAEPTPSASAHGGDAGEGDAGGDAGKDAEAPAIALMADEDAGDASAEKPPPNEPPSESTQHSIPTSASIPAPTTPPPPSCQQMVLQKGALCDRCDLQTCFNLTELCAQQGDKTALIFVSFACLSCGARGLPAYSAWCKRYGYE